MFESKVLAVVTKTLATEGDFFNGSLFVECSAAEAAKLETALLEEVSLWEDGGCGVIVSKASATEFSFDFV